MTIVRLDNLDDPRLDAYARLTHNQLRNRLEPASAIVIAESATVVEVALQAGMEPLSMLVEETRLGAAECAMSMLPAGVPVYVLGQGKMSRLVGFNVTRGILAELRRPAPLSPEEVLAGASRVAVLEGLVDVTNVGAIFRNAAALGVDAVLLSPDCADPFSRRALRVSMGCAAKVPWAFCDEPWPGTAMQLLRDRGFTTCAMALVDDAVPLGDVSLASHERLALFFGCEGYGLARNTILACDRRVVIPMAHGVDSLNVAASSAVAFWELFSRR